MIRSPQLCALRTGQAGKPDLRRSVARLLSLASAAALIAPGMAAADEAPLSPSYVPSQAGLVLTIRPAAILAEPAMAPIAAAIKGQRDAMARELGAPLDHVEQVTFAFHELSAGNRPTITLRVKEPGDALGIIRRYFTDSVEAQHAGRKYRKASDGNVGCLLLSGESRMVVLAESEEILRALLDADGAGAKPAERAWPWEEVSRAHAAVFLQTGLLRRWLDEGDRRVFQGGIDLAMAPVWQNSTSIALRLTVDERLRLTAKMAAPTADDAKRVAATLSAVATLGGNVTSGLRKQLAGQPIPPPFVDELNTFFEGLSIQRNETQVTLAGSAKTEAIGGLLATAIPEIAGDMLRARTLWPPTRGDIPDYPALQDMFSVAIWQPVEMNASMQNWPKTKEALTRPELQKAFKDFEKEPLPGRSSTPEREAARAEAIRHIKAAIDGAKADAGGDKIKASLDAARESLQKMQRPF